MDILEPQAMKVTRRAALKLGLLSGGTWLANPIQDAAAQTPICDREDPIANPGPNPGLPPFSPAIPPFQQPLRLMTLLSPVVSKTYPVVREGQTIQQPIDYYEITLQQQIVELLPSQNGKPAVTTKVWSYNGLLPGPLIRQGKKRESCIRFINQLGQDEGGTPICTSVHLHGMASLPQYDGYAEDLTPPGYYKDYYYPNNRASILWYHDHALHKTSRNVYMGLAGMYIVDYAPEDFCRPEDFGRLPRGEFEVPLIIQDKTFEMPQNDSSQPWRLVFNDRNRQGVYADLVLLNGVPFPHFRVKRRKYFFRLLNGSASRTYQLTLSPEPDRLLNTVITVNGQPLQLTIVGSDAGLLAEPVHLNTPAQSLRLGVAERYGVVIDFGQLRPDVKQMYLRNAPFPGNLGTEPIALMRFDLDDEGVTDESEVPKMLGILTRRQELETRSVGDRTFRFGRGRHWTINGQTWSADRVSANPKQCEIEVWNLVNMGGWTHPVHIHLIDFQIIDRNGQPPLPYERGWKDVVLLSPFETIRVVARFGPHRGKYMMHCHNIVHEDHDMMNQFEVGQGGAGPLSDPAKPLPAAPLASTPPPVLVEPELPCLCYVPLANNCGVVIQPPPRCQT